ncbi:TetR/AcrR family transcriptional regulator [Streptomyces sp. NPDC090798]|uniref:TetR/AcrR family transcriptional regulator n=1 Tax=Streptomyces sp. NPDC090798 TaxID=3365968 RepID=UPI00382A950E
MDDIAEAAGVGKATLFRRFGDRAGLIGAVIDSRLEPLRQAVRQAQDAGLSSPYQAEHYGRWHEILRHWIRCPASTTRISPPTLRRPSSAPTSWHT